ncbi:MAG: PBP1A family penicillin-binding protein [Patescibacteria group bacterium]
MQISYSYSPSHKSGGKKPTLKYTRRSVSRGTWLKRLFVVMGICGAIGSVAFIGLIAYYSKNLPDPNKLMDRAVPLSTKIYDRSGTVLLYDIHRNEQRTLVSLKDIPEALKHATIVAEDRGFYQHKGFDLKGILRALAVDILRGRTAQGGSTITQQFIKNALLSSKKTLTRKIQELILAYQIERRFTKDEILQLYLNEIPYGSTAYGVQAAAQTYFDKDVHSLSLSESVLLASLPKAPSYYSPWGNNRDKLIARQRSILQSMVEEGYITQVEADDALAQPLIFREDRQSIKAPHFVFYIKQLLTDMYGEKVVEEGGLKITTTLDYDKQQIAQEALEKQGKKNISIGASNAALVSLDARTGEIKAMVGSRDYFDESIDGSVNVVLRKRQPGSSFKPIAYAAAFQKGYTPSTIVFDLKTDFDTTGAKPYTPLNYSGKEYGPVTLRKALAGSLNIASVKLLYLTGVPFVVDFAKKIGYSSLEDPDRYGLALILGGGEVTLLEHVAGFASLAQEGKQITPYGLLRVESKDGSVLFEAKPPLFEQTYDPEIARNITSILSDNSARSYIFGTKNYLTLSDRAVAAKTGTTNDFHDAWTIGYTPSVVTGVWVGNNNNTAMHKGADGSKIAAPIWNEYMKRTLSVDAIESFTQPAPITTGKPILDGEISADEELTVDRITGLAATDTTPLDRIEIRKTRSIHDTLYWVQKDDPRGPAPQQPIQDPQFMSWERGVQEWVKKNPQSLATTLTHPQESGSLQDLPTISIESPLDSENITDNILQARVQVQSSRGIRMVQYFLDNQLLDTVITPPYTLHHTLSGGENGFHTLTALATDVAGGIQSASITLNILLNKKIPVPLISTPSQNQVVQKNVELTFSGSLVIPQGADIAHIKRILAFVSSSSSQNPVTIGSVQNPQSSQWSFLWTTPSQPGDYTLTIQLLDSLNTVISQRSLSVFAP